MDRGLSNYGDAGADILASGATTFEAELLILVTSCTSLVTLTDQIGRGERVGKDAETAMLLVDISTQFGAVTKMLFARDTNHLKIDAIGRAQRRPKISE